MLVVAASVALAAYWVFLVPILQAPDEDAHFDYAMTYYSAGRPVGAFERPVQHNAHQRGANPFVVYLEMQSGFDVIRHAPAVKAPPGYGSAAFYDELDGKAPVNKPQVQNPSLINGYPFLPPALTAAWMSLVHLLFPRALALFFGARLLSSALLGISLLLTFAVMRELNLTRPRALAITAITGLLPLSSFVSSYVQPEALGLTTAMLSIYASLRLRRRPDSAWLAVLLGVALGTLWVSKGQYLPFVAVPIAGMLAGPFAQWGRGHERRLLTHLAIISAPSVLLVGLNLWLTQLGNPGVNTNASRGTNFHALYVAVHHGPVDAFKFLAGSTGTTFHDFYLSGQPFATFWGDFGWVDTNMITSQLVMAGLVAGTLLLLALGLAHLLLGLRVLKLGETSHRLGRLSAVLFANPLVAATLGWTAFLFAYDTATAQTVDTQGRYWFPVLPGVIYLATEFAPAAFSSRRLRWLSSTGAYVALIAYCVGGSLVALSVVHHRYYGNGRSYEPIAVSGLAVAPGGSGAFEYLVPSGRDFSQPPQPVVPQDGQLAVGGWSQAPGHQPPRAVLVVLDGGRSVQAVSGDDGPVAGLKDGFDTILQIGNLQTGRHELRLIVVSADGTAYQPAASAAFWVVPSGAT